MRLIDTHLHLIDRAVTGHAWTARAPALAGRDFPLEEALALYEQGMRLTALCTAHLQQAQVRIVQIDAALAELLGQAGDSAGDDAEPDW